MKLAIVGSRGLKINNIEDYIPPGVTLKRNQAIAEYADAVIAFWDGKSKGTKYTVDIFKKSDKRVKVVIVENI